MPGCTWMCCHMIPCSLTSYLFCNHILKGKFLFFLFFFLTFIPFGVTGRLLESIPATYERRQVHPWMSAQLIQGPMWAFEGSVPWRCSEGVHLLIGPTNCVHNSKSEIYMRKAINIWKVPELDRNSCNDDLYSVQLLNACLVNIFPINCSSPTEISLQIWLLNVVKCLVLLAIPHMSTRQRWMQSFYCESFIYSI